MFCPNCGTQNPDGSQACSKCGFQLKGASVPKFKGTMMMNQAPAAAVPVPPPATARPASVPGQGPGAAAGPSAFKGTVVGGGFGQPIAPTPPRAPSTPPPAPPAPYAAPPQAQVQPPAQSYGSQPPPYAPPVQPYGGGGGNVNPMGSTVADANPSYSYGAAAPYAQQQQGMPPQDGGYGQPPPPTQGSPYGTAPSQPPQQPYGGMQGQGQGPSQPYGAPPGGYDPSQNPNQGAMQLAPQQNAYAPQVYGAPGAQPYGPPPGMGGMMQAGQPGPMTAGGNGPKGQVRDGMKTLILAVCTFGIYQMIWFISICGEMSAFLKRDEPSWMKILGLSIVTCGVYAIYWQAVKLGAIIAEVQQRAGVQNPTNHGIMYIIPYYNIILVTEELNKAWQIPG